MSVINQNDRKDETDNSTRRVYKVAIIAPTCFYYQVPLFRTLASHPRIDLKVYFCSDEAIRGADLQSKFGRDGDWGVEDDMLAGYISKFLPNYSLSPSYLTSGFGLLNLGIWKEIRNERPDAVILMSWMNPTWWLAILACLQCKIPFLYLTDQNQQRDLMASKLKRWIKDLILGRMIFKLAEGFLCAGTSNRQFYTHYGVPESKLVSFAFSWGYESLIQESNVNDESRRELRNQLGIDEERVVILFCGRLSHEKNAHDLLRAYEIVDNPNKSLVFVGDGETRRSLEEHVENHGLKEVNFVGFQDRRQIPKYYAMADMLVLPSQRETWGIVVNEALCFGLPVITSDQVGAGQDMVQHGENGFEFSMGDVESLASYIRQIIEMPKQSRLEMGARSKDVICTWLNRNLGDDLTNHLDSMFPLTSVSRQTHP